MKKPELKIEERSYPNGQAYRTVTWGGEVAGTYAIVEGGFLPFGCRKVLADEKEAQWKVA